jgi:hypothetical protein
MLEFVQMSLEQSRMQPSSSLHQPTLGDDWRSIEMGAIL